MSKFRFLVEEPGLYTVAYGLPEPREVKKGDVIEVSDEIARPALMGVDDTGETVELRKADTYADGYRNQPTMWAEVGAAVPQPPAPKAAVPESPAPKADEQPKEA